MKINVTKSTLSGQILVPGSKSHTVRGLSLAAMANGSSVIKNALLSDDTISCLEAIKIMGAQVEQTPNQLVINGVSGKIGNPCSINVGNSGTSLRLLTALAALSDVQVNFDGDGSIRKRPMKPLLTALQNLGAKVKSTDGKCPFSISGPVKGGFTEVDGISSQFLSALLFATPLAPLDSEIKVIDLHEKPYVNITLDWLSKLDIDFSYENMEIFKIKGRQQYKAFDISIPADFSSATFALCAAAVTKSELLIKGLDFSDHQGDKVVFEHLEKMGANIKYTNEGVLVNSAGLTGIDMDLNATPDALPALAVTGCFAKGTTKLLNVKQARLKECDRISAMYTELSKMGANVEELEDGLIIHESKLTGAEVHGYDDHRMVMSLAIAGMIADNKTTIDTAEAVSVTYPTFNEDFRKIGANIKEIN